MSAQSSTPGAIYSDGQYLDANPDWHLEDTAWKASEIAKILDRNEIEWKNCTEVGCGSGGIVASLANTFPDRTVSGYEISPDAAGFWKTLELPENASLKVANFLEMSDKHDVICLIDVFEHVEDYIGFVRALGPRASHHVFHIPLDMHVQGMMRGSYMEAREKVGHLHYFSRRSALATLETAGYRVIDWHFTDISVNANISTRQTRTMILNPLRKLISLFSKDAAATLLGGYSLMVLCELNESSESSAHNYGV